MIFLFLSVVAVCAAGLLGFRMHLQAAPGSRADLKALVDRVEKLEGRTDKLSLAALGKRTG